MNYLHTHARRLFAAVLLAGAVGLAATLALSAFSASARGSAFAPNTVSYYHQSKLLGSTTVANGSSLDVVWKDTACSNAYGSPPTAFTFSGGSTGATSAPAIGPCGHEPGSSRQSGPNDLTCTFSLDPPYIYCYWTYKNSGGAATSSARISNPGHGTAGNMYLYKRTVLYAYLVTPGTPKKKMSVPAGTDTVKFTHG